MKRSIPIKALLHFLLVTGCLLAIYPMFIMVSGSFKTAAEFAANPAGLPRSFTFNNYVRLWNYNSGLILRTFINSVGVSGAYTALTLFIASLAAFAFAKYSFKGRKILFALLLATMMIPMEVNIPPMYLLFSRIKWLNSYQVQVLPGIANVFALFMIRQYMESIPDAIIESAVVDGAGHGMVYARIVMPAAKPVLGALTILLFLNKWNDYMWPMIMVHNPRMMPVSVILPTLNDSGSLQSIPWELVLTGCSIVTVPIILCFLLFQDRFMQSMTIGAVKG